MLGCGCDWGASLWDRRLRQLLRRVKKEGFWMVLSGVEDDLACRDPHEGKKWTCGR
jgi:hypothetical protein